MRHHSGPENGTLPLYDTGPKGWIGTTGIKSALIGAAFLAALVSLLITLSASNAGAARVCDKTASSNVQGLVDSLRPGQTGCLRGGVYTDKQVVFKNGGASDANRLTLQSYPGETAEFRGGINIPEGTNFVSVSNMRLDGSYGPVETTPGKDGPRTNTAQTIKVLGGNVTIRDNNITNRRSPDLSGTCIILGSSRTTAAKTFIEGNRIHHCGQIPRTNHEHGIYASHSVDSQVVDNLFYENADRGVQLFPDTRRMLVAGNVIDSNGEGLVINDASSDNTVRNNVLSNPNDWNINRGPILSGSGNRVSDNCFWAPGGKSAFKNGGKNTSVSGNVTANPSYQDLQSLKITNRACLAKYSGTQAR